MLLVSLYIGGPQPRFCREMEWSRVRRRTLSMPTSKRSATLPQGFWDIMGFNEALSMGNLSASHEVAVKVASWRWDHVGVYITIIVFVVVSGLAKVGKFPRGAYVSWHQLTDYSFLSLPPCWIHIIKSTRILVSKSKCPSMRCNCNA